MAARPPLTCLTSGFGLLEGARWYDATGLVFSDMTNGGVHALTDDGPQPLIEHRKGIGGLVAHAAGGFVISGRNVAHRRVGANASPTIVVLAPQEDEQFFNDLTADRTGAVFVGSVAKRTEGALSQPAGRLYRIGVDGRVDVLAADVLVSNGLATDPDERHLYHVDSNRRLIWTFDVAADDLAESREPFVDTSEYAGVPDGLCVATDGSVWVAMAGGSVVVAWDAQGRRVEEVPVSQPLVTSVCFGGTDRRTFYVLTGCNEEFPDDQGGAIYRTDVGRTGLPAPLARVMGAPA